MLEITQKEVCLKIKDNLLRQFPHAKSIIANTTYTHVKMIVSDEVVKPDLLEKLMRILQSDCHHLYRPFPTQKRFVAILDNHFADIDLRINEYDGCYEYNIYITVPSTTIQWEWWYEQFLESI